MNDFDVVIVGASVAGCTAARLYAQRGARVALVEKRPDVDAYKTVCTHYIQPSATPTIEKLGLAPLIEARGGVRNSIDLWTPYGGWIRSRGDTPYGYSVTRRVLDPLLRRMTAETAGVELLCGSTATGLLADGRPGVVVEDRRHDRRELRARLVVAADGRDSQRRADGRRPGARAPAQPLLLLGVLERRSTGRRPLADVVHGARLRLRLPERERALPAPRRPPSLPVCPSSAPTSRAALPSVPSPRCPTHRTFSPPHASRSCWASSTCRASAGRRHARARLGRRRRARLRPAVGRRLRVGVPERRLARRRDGGGARRGRRPRRRARLVPPGSTGAASARTTS